MKTQEALTLLVQIEIIGFQIQETGIQFLEAALETKIILGIDLAALSLPETVSLTGENKLLIMMIMTIMTMRTQTYSHHRVGCQTLSL